MIFSDFLSVVSQVLISQRAICSPFLLHCCTSVILSLWPFSHLQDKRHPIFTNKYKCKFLDTHICTSGFDLASVGLNDDHRHSLAILES